MLIEVLFIVVNSKSKSKSKLEFLSISFTITSKKKTKDQRDRKSKSNKFQSLLSFLNVHASLYLANLARVYFIVINVNVLIEEIKHILILIFYSNCY